MYIYHDYSYVEYILNSEANKGLLLYSKCLDRINDEISKHHDDRLWQAFINSGIEGQTFDEFKASMKYRSNKMNLSHSEKVNEETRIIKNSEDLRKIIEAKDKEMSLKKIAKLNVEEG